MNRLAVCLILLLALAAGCAAASSILIRNNYDMPYYGPIAFKTSVPNDFFQADGTALDVYSGQARGVVKLAPHSQVRPSPVHALHPQKSPITLKVDPTAGGLALVVGEKAAVLYFSLCAIPGRTGDTTAAVSSFQRLELVFDTEHGYPWVGTTRAGDYEVEVSAMPYAEGFLDMDVTVTNKSDSKESTYLALVRKIAAPEASDFKMRWNGGILAGDTEPTKFEGSWGLDHCVDWFSWKSRELSYCAVSGFTPGLTTETSPGRWQNANHTYVWEHVVRQGNSVFMISEISGPDPSQKPGYKGIKAYIPPLKGEPVKLHYRIAISPKPEKTWQESQFLVYAGYRKLTTSADSQTLDLGVGAVEFGTSYFPYSTMCENFDYLRTPSLDREGWWPFAPEMWKNWRAYAPQMRTDLRIIKSMGFGWVRMHHLELVTEMDRKEALAFIDFYMNECRKLGLKVLIDFAGTPDWFTQLAGKYKDVAQRVEIENEILIPGIHPGDAERWTECYKAAKAAAPNTDVFLTGSCNVGIFDRLDKLGVPYDRLGYHTYKHGPGADETLSSLAVGMAGVSAEKGKTPILSEFNWKFLTRMSPEARAREYAAIFGNILKERQVPELLQFHWQETMSVNPRLTRQGIRHYETIYLDRRPKPEAKELMKLIKRYSSASSPIRELPITVSQAQFANGVAKAKFSVTNTSAKPVTVDLSAESFGDATSRITSAPQVTIAPGKTAGGTIEIKLKPKALPGVYHFFVRAEYGHAELDSLGRQWIQQNPRESASKTSYGWGYASNYGAPVFGADSVIKDLVEYPTGSKLEDRIDWTKPICVAFGPDCPIVEMEMAYVIANTLQSATGRSIRLCNTNDIGGSGIKYQTLILVGTQASNPLIAAQSESLLLTPGKGSVTFLQHKDAKPAPACLILTGDKPEAVEAASTDFVLRYWKNAKDSIYRITGLEKGAALGNKAAPGLVNPP